MSPEQVSEDPRDVGIQADVYAVGVILYELLSGQLPLHLEACSLPEAARRIRDVTPPRLSELERSLRGDVETIVAKALEKDRARRYASAASMAEDLRRFLANEPIEAKRDSMLYVLRKRMRRYRTAIGAGLLMIVLTTLFGVASWQQALVNRRLAESEGRAKADALTSLRTAQEERAHAESARARADQQAEAYRRSLYANWIAQARAAWDERRAARMKQLLSQCPEDLRGWEWSFLAGLADESRQTIEPDADAQYALAVSPDGSEIACGGDAALIHIVDRRSGKIRRTFGPMERPATWLVYSPDGARLAFSTKGTRAYVSVLDAESGDEISRLEGHERAVWYAAISRDGDRILSGSEDRTLRLWDLASRRTTQAFVGHAGIVRAVEFVAAADWEQVVSAGDDGFVIVGHADGREAWRQRDQEQNVRALAAARDGRWIASGGEDGRIRLRRGDDGRIIWDVPTQAGAVHALAVDPDNDLLASGSEDGSIRVWSVADGKIVCVLLGHNDCVNALAFSPTGLDGDPRGDMWLASCARDHTLKFWNRPGTERIRTIRAHQSSIGTVACEPIGDRILTTGADRTLQLRQARSLELLNTFAFDAILTDAAFHRDRAFSGQIVAGSADGALMLLDSHTGDVLTSRPAHQGAVKAIAISSDGSRILSAGSDGLVKIWSSDLGSTVMTVEPGDNSIRSLEFARDSDAFVVAGSQNGRLRTFATQTGQQRWSTDAHGGVVFAARLTPDGSRILSCGRDSVLRLWDTASGAPLGTLSGHTHSIAGVVLSPDGSRAVSAGYDNTLKLWNLSTGEELLTLSGAPQQLHRALAFSPDGCCIYAGSADGSLTIWDAAANQPTDTR